MEGPGLHLYFSVELALILLQHIVYICGGVLTMSSANDAVESC